MRLISLLPINPKWVKNHATLDIMPNNLTCTITECTEAASPGSYVQLEDLGQCFMDDSLAVVETDQERNNRGSAQAAMVLHYSSNFTVRELLAIAKYYSAPLKRMKKQQLVSHLVQFELDPTNRDIVASRRKCWSLLGELAKDPFFAKSTVTNCRPWNLRGDVRVQLSMSECQVL